MFLILPKREQGSKAIASAEVMATGLTGNKVFKVKILGAVKKVSVPQTLPAFTATAPAAKLLGKLTETVL